MVSTVKFFLSYPREQSIPANEVWEFLHSLDLDVWFDREILIGGQNWDRERQNAQKAADLTILIWSKEAASRPGVIQVEINEAIGRQSFMPFGTIMLVVCRVEEISVPTELSALQYIDLFNSDWKFKLSRSIALKFEQMQMVAPEKFVDYFSNIQNLKRVKAHSIACDEGGVSLKANYLTYAKAGQFWEYVNCAVRANVLGSYARFGFEGRGLINEVVRSVSWSVDMEEFFSEGDFLSLIFDKWWNYGGPHPNRGIYALNFDESAGGKLDLAEIFGHNREVLQYLKEVSEIDVRRQILIADGRLSEYSLDGYVNLDSYDGWNIFSQWSASREGLSVYLSQCSELPFVMGVFRVQVPWDFLKKFVAEEYLGTNIYGLMA